MVLQSTVKVIYILIVILTSVNNISKEDSGVICSYGVDIGDDHMIIDNNSTNGGGTIYSNGGDVVLRKTIFSGTINPIKQ